jgi:hypothetical protein
LRQVRLELTGASNEDAGEDGLRLLLDIKAVFMEASVDELPSIELAHALVKIETSPWGERLLDKKGNPSTAKLARLLRPFGVCPDRIGGKASQTRGYTLSWFQDAFDRYLPSQTVNPSTDRENSGDREDFIPSTECAVDASENTPPPSKNAGGGRVDTLRPRREADTSEPRIFFAEDEEVTL